MKTLEQLKTEGKDTSNAELEHCIICGNLFYSLCPKDDTCSELCYEKKSNQ